MARVCLGRWVMEKQSDAWSEGACGRVLGAKGLSGGQHEEKGEKERWVLQMPAKAGVCRMNCGPKSSPYCPRANRIRWAAIVLVSMTAKRWMRFSIAYGLDASGMRLMRRGSVQVVVLIAAFKSGPKPASFGSCGYKVCSAMTNTKGLSGNGRRWMAP